MITCRPPESRCPATFNTYWTDPGYGTTHDVEVRCSLDAGHTVDHRTTLTVRGVYRGMRYWPNVEVLL